MIIKKLEFKFSEDGDYQSIPITGYSCSFNEDCTQTAHGLLYTDDVSAYSPLLSPSQSDVFHAIAARRAIFRITDNAGHAFIIGSNDIKAPLSFDKLNEGSPGKKYGYKLKIKHKSSSPAALQVL